MASKTRRVTSFSNVPIVYGTNLNKSAANNILRESRRSINVKERNSKETPGYNATAAKKMAEIESQHNSPGAILDAISKLKDPTLKKVLTHHARQLYKKTWIESIFGTRKRVKTNVSPSNARVNAIVSAYHDAYNAREEEREKRAWRREEVAMARLGPTIARRQNLASQKRVLETEAEEFLREHRINPGDSTLSLIKQAQLLTEAEKALKAKGKNINTYMRNPGLHDLVAGEYTFRMHTSENAKNSEFETGLYVFKTTDPDNYLLIHP